MSVLRYLGTDPISGKAAYAVTTPGGFLDRLADLAEAEGMHVQVCDVSANRDMGGERVRGVIELTADYMEGYAESLDRRYALSYGFSEGDRYEVRVWDGEDCAWSAEYTFTDGRLRGAL